MVKRIICILCVTVTIIFNCIPVFALSPSDITLGGNDTIPPELVNFMVENSNYNYYYVFGRRNGSNFKIIIYSTSNFSVRRADGNEHLLRYTNYTDSNINVYSSNPDFNYSLGPNEVYDFNYGGDRFYYWIDFVVSRGGYCVSVDACSPDSYIDSSTVPDPDDYEEDGISIKGLTGFFNNMINGLKSVKDSIVNLPTTIINGLKDLFIPNSENMKSDFNDFISFFRNKLGYGPILDTLNSMVNVDGGSLSAANFKKDFSFNIGGSDVNMSFVLPFSNYFSGDARSDMVNYMKGLFFILLIFYNLSEIYFLIRGVRPWKDPVIHMTLNEIQRNDVNSYIANVKGQDHGV